MSARAWPYRRMVTPSGWRVEAIVLNDRSLYRIKRHGFWVADVATLEDVQRTIGADFLRLEEQP